MSRLDYRRYVHQRRRQGRQAAVIAIVVGVVLVIVLVIVVALNVGKESSRDRQERLDRERWAARRAAAAAAAAAKAKQEVKEESETSPAAGEASWRPVEEFSGRSHTTTEPFRIRGRSWRIYWENDAGWASAESFQITVCAGRAVTGERLILPETREENWCERAGPGEFTLRVAASGPWRISVYEWR